MKIRSRSLLLSLTVLLTALCLVPAVLPAQSCDEVRFRLWQKDVDTAAWFAHGEAVEIGPGESGHVYVHVSDAAAGRSSHYATRAIIGYPENLAMEKTAGRKHTDRARTQRGRAGQIADHLTIKPQDGSDRDVGRIQLEAKAPGETRLSYRIEGVKSPGRLEIVPPPCRTGVIPIRVTANVAEPAHGHEVEEEHEADEAHESHRTDRHAAAEELTSELMSAFLRRDVTDAEEAFVNQIFRHGRDGILSVAGHVASSREFRTTALQRTDEAHDEGHREKHRSGLADLRTQLLDDIYRDLYGYVEPSRDEQNADLRDLEICLDGRENACERLGREIVARSAFYDHHRELLDRIAEGAVRR